MPIRMLNFLTSPPPERMSKKSLENLEEWQDFMMALGAGLKPHEYISVSFPPEHQIHKKLKNANAAFISAAKYRIRKLQLPYDVYERDGVVFVVGRGVLS